MLSSFIYCSQKYSGKFITIPQNKNRKILEVEEETKSLPNIYFEIALEITSQNLKSVPYFDGLPRTMPQQTKPKPWGLFHGALNMPRTLNNLHHIVSDLCKAD